MSISLSKQSQMKTNGNCERLHILNFIARLYYSEWMGYIGIFKNVLIEHTILSMHFESFNDECAGVTGAQDPE